MRVTTNSKRRLNMKSILRRFGATVVSVALLFLASVALAGNGNSGSGNGNGNGGSGGNHGNRADNGRNKIADDLDRVLNGRGSGREKWVKPSLRGSQVSVLILANGASDADLKAYLVSRYGEFILLEPRFSPGNAVLWLTPFLVVVLGAGVVLVRRRPAAAEADGLSEPEKARLATLIDN